MKSQRALARGAQSNIPEDVTILNFYLYVSFLQSFSIASFISSKVRLYCAVQQNQGSNTGRLLRVLQSRPFKT